MMTPLFIGLFVMSLLGIYFFLRPNVANKVVARRLDEINLSYRQPVDEIGLERQLSHNTGLSHQLGEYVSKFNFADDVKLLILHAGSTTTVGSVIGGSIVAALGLGLLLHLTVGFVLLDFAGVAVGASSRWLLLRFQRSRRVKKFDAALPDAIDLMARALRAGHSIASTVEIVAEQSDKALAAEFAILFQQQKLGIQFRDALLEVGDRVPSKDLHFLITAILVQKETGGDLTDVLDRTARIIRERVRIHAEIKTYTAQGRLTGMILGALPIIMLVFLNLVTPGYSYVLFHDPLGQKLLYAGATMITIGGLIIRKIVDIEV